MTDTSPKFAVTSLPKRPIPRDAYYDRRHLIGGQDVLKEPVSRSGIAERDKWTCQICLYPVNHTGRGPLCYEIDHKDPFGPHILENLRVAHQWCNRTKGTGESDPEILEAQAALAMRLHHGRTVPLPSTRTVRGWFKTRSVYLTPDEYGQQARDWAKRLPAEIEAYEARLSPEPGFGVGP
jgi:hypothetical protein